MKSKCKIVDIKRLESYFEKSKPFEKEVELPGITIDFVLTHRSRVGLFDRFICCLFVVISTNQEQMLHVKQHGILQSRNTFICVN